MVHTHLLDTEELGAGTPEIQTRCWLHSKTEANLGYMKLLSQKNKREESKGEARQLSGQQKNLTSALTVLLNSQGSYICRTEKRRCWKRKKTNVPELTLRVKCQGWHFESLSQAPASGCRLQNTPLLIHMPSSQKRFLGASNVSCVALRVCLCGSERVLVSGAETRNSGGHSNPRDGQRCPKTLFHPLLGHKDAKTSVLLLVHIWAL